METEYNIINNISWILCIEKFTSLFCKEFKNKFKQNCSITKCNKQQETIEFESF